MQMNMPPGHVILDTGCRTGVAGKLCHVDFQRALDQCGMESSQRTTRRSFVLELVIPSCPPTPTSTQCRSMTITVGCACRDSRVSECPGLVGQAELARWKAD